MKVLVAGGTGRLGRLLVHDLTGRGVEVTVLTRDPSRAAHLTQKAEVAVGDLREPKTLIAAVAGAQVVVSAAHGFVGPGKVTPASVDRDGNLHLFDAATRAGAEVVMVSVYGASPANPMELFRCKWEAEEALKRGSAPWTIVQATAFVELWAELLRRGIIFGRGDNPINFVSVRDVAAAVSGAVVDPSTRGRTLTVSGPENLTFNQLAHLVSDDPARPVRTKHVPRTALRLLAPLHRMARAALSMDTLDMTAPAGGATPVKEALALQL